MEELRIRLDNIADTYYGFVAGVLTYAKKSQERLAVVNRFLDENPDALSSDVLSFISKQDDFFEDAAYAKVI